MSSRAEDDYLNVLKTADEMIQISGDDIEIVIIFDVSRSMAGHFVERIKSSMRTMIPRSLQQKIIVQTLGGYFIDRPTTLDRARLNIGGMTSPDGVIRYLREYEPSGKRRIFVVYTDGELSGYNAFENFRSALMESYTDDILKVHLGWPGCIRGCDALKDIWVEVCTSGENAIPLETFPVHEPTYLAELINSLASSGFTVQPPGYISVFGRLAYRADVPSAVVIEAVRRGVSSGEIPLEDIHKIRDELLTIMEVSPEKLTGEGSGMPFVHKMLVRVLSKAYRDVISQILGRCTDSAKAAAIRALLDSLRNDKEDFEEVLRLIEPYRLGKVLSVGWPEGSRAAVNALIADGSFFKLISACSEIFTQARIPKVVLDLTAVEGLLGMPIVSATLETPEDVCRSALGLFFAEWSEYAFLSGFQLFALGVFMLTSEIELPREVVCMIMRGFMDPIYIAEMLGVDPAGAVNLNDKMFNPLISKRVVDMLRQYPECLAALTPEHQAHIMRVYGDLARYSAQFSACRATRECALGAPPITAEFEVPSDNLGLQVGCLVILKPGYDDGCEPSAGVPLCGIVISNKGRKVRVYQLDQHDLMHNGSVDTHNCRRSQIRDVLTTPVVAISEHVSDLMIRELLMGLPADHIVSRTRDLLQKMMEETRDDPSVRAANDDELIAMVTEGRPKFEIEKVEIPVKAPQVLAHFAAKHRISEVIVSAARQGQTTLSRAQMEKLLEYPEPPRDVSPQKVMVGGRPTDYDMSLHYTGYYRETFLQERPLRTLSELEHVTCLICMDDEIPLEDAVRTRCFHAMCRDCSEGLTAAGMPTPGGDFQPSNYQCVHCLSWLDTPYESVTRFIQTNPDLTSGQPRFCADCGEVFIAEVACGGTAEATRCDGCARLAESDLHRSFVECPGCGVATSRSSGCDVVACANCDMAFCYGCSHPFGIGMFRTVYDWRCSNLVIESYPREYMPNGTSGCETRWGERVGSDI